MLNSVFGITQNPFGKEIPPKDIFISSSWKQALSRLNFLIHYRGIAIITGEEVYPHPHRDLIT